MTTDPTDFNGCHSECRRRGTHSLVWGGCEHAPEPEPTVSLSRVDTAADGHPSIAYDTYTVTQLAALVEPALRTAVIRAGQETADRARAAAHAIVHRHDEQPTPVPSAPTTDQAASQVRDDVLRALDAPLCQTLGYLTPEQLLDAYDTTTRAAVYNAAAEAVDELSMQVEQAMKRHEIGPLTALQDAADVLRRLAAGAQQPEPGAARTADGATALRDAADFFERVLEQSLDPGNDPRYCTAVRDIVMGLRRQADECTAGAQQQPTTETQPPTDPEDTEALRVKVETATATLRRVRYTLASLKDRGATGQAYHRAITDALAGPRPDDTDEPAPVSAAETADQIATRHHADGWHQRAQGAQDVADMLRAGEREEQRRG